jgi:leader peptidase (prepilin peptidase)/N-methyltransferase
MILAWVFLLGLVVGSFLNVCIFRLPRGESLVRPGSHCPSCGRPIRPSDNLPLLSYLLLRGRCRFCGDSISWRYPLVEAMTGLGFVLVVARFGLTLPAFLHLLFFSALMVLAFIDLEHQILPDAITLPGIPLGVAAAVFPLLASCLSGAEPGPLWPSLRPRLLSSLLGLLLGGGLFWLIAFLGQVLLKREAMGGGDIKLAAMIGAYLGWRLLLLTIFLAAFSGSLVGIFLLRLHLRGREEPIPFGPFLSLGAFLSMLGGDWVVGWYASFLR